MQQKSVESSTCIWSILAIIFAFVFPVLGIVFGIVALVKIGKNPNLSGKGLAIAGIVIGGIFTLAIPILVSVGTLAYFGVLSPEKMLPKRCTMSAGLACVDFKAFQDGSLTLVISNHLGNDLESVKLSVTEDCTPKDIIWKEGEQIEFKCNIPKGKKGERFRSAIDIEYISSGGLKHSATGNIITMYE